MGMEGIYNACSSAAQATLSYVDPREYGYNLPSSSQVASNVSQYALPLITIAALSSLPSAEAGPVTGTACVVAAMAAAGVSGGAASPFINFCWWAFASLSP